MSKEKEGAIRPGDIPVKTDKHETVLSPVVSDLAASLLIDPLQMSVRPPRGRQIVDGTEFNREIRATREKVDNLLKKYEEVK